MTNPMNPMDPTHPTDPIDPTHPTHPIDPTDPTDPTDQPIVVGVDGSRASLRAVDWAADEAALRGAALRLVHASVWERYEGGLLAPDPDEPSERELIEDMVAVAERRARHRQPGVRVTTAVLPEEPEYTLVRESRTALAVVLGSRGRGATAEAMEGSVTAAVAGHAHCPVIVIPGGQDPPAHPRGWGRIVLGVGERPAGSAAVRFAVEEASVRGVPLDAVRAWRHPAPVTAARGPHALAAPAPAEQQAAELLEDALRDAPADMKVDRRALEGHPRDVLTAVSRQADLLVVGARRHHGHFGPRLGRIAHGALHHAACPVAVVPELS
jgi:nucleotide-binding universal stress UspA family protein